jgi:hypothetical protein
LAGIKLSSIDRGSPHHGPTLRGLSHVFNVRQALKAVIAQLFSGAEL